VGLVLQLDGLWQSNRQTAHTLNQLDGELSQVRYATTVLASRNKNVRSLHSLLLDEDDAQRLIRVG
jgi:hypothetical protein